MKLKLMGILSILLGIVFTISCNAGLIRNDNYTEVKAEYVETRVGDVGSDGAYKLYGVYKASNSDAGYLADSNEASLTFLVNPDDDTEYYKKAEISDVNFYYLFLSLFGIIVIIISQIFNESNTGKSGKSKKGE